MGIGRAVLIALPEFGANPRRIRLSPVIVLKETGTVLQAGQPFNDGRPHPARGPKGVTPSETFARRLLKPKMLKEQGISSTELRAVWKRHGSCSLVGRFIVEALTV